MFWTHSGPTVLLPTHFHTCTINQDSTSETDMNAARLPLCTVSESVQMWMIKNSVTDKVRRPQKTKKSEMRSVISLFSLIK